MRGAPFDPAGQSLHLAHRYCPQEQMHMIRLNRQLEQLPGMLFNDLLDDLLQTVVNRPNQNLAPSFWAPDEVIDHQMDTMAFMLIFHVVSLADIYEENKPFPSPKQGTVLHPPHS